MRLLHLEQTDWLIDWCSQSSIRVCQVACGFITMRCLFSVFPFQTTICIYSIQSHNACYCVIMHWLTHIQTACLFIHSWYSSERSSGWYIGEGRYGRDSSPMSKSWIRHWTSTCMKKYIILIRCARVRDRSWYFGIFVDVVKQTVKLHLGHIYKLNQAKWISIISW